MRRVDCIIVGGGPAGTFCASTLAEHSISCALVERRASMEGKVCGGGISRYGVQVLNRIGFPVDLLLSYGIKVERSINLLENGTVVEDRWKDTAHKADYAIGIARDDLDAIFLRSAISHGVIVQLGCSVARVEQSDGLYVAGDFTAPIMVLACGATNSLVPAAITTREQLPFGVSALYQSSMPQPGMFVFDYSDAYADGYAWIFSIGTHKWNVGVWSRNPHPDMKALFQHFAQTRMPQLIGVDAVCIQIPKGAFIGTRKNAEKLGNGFYIAGDAAGSAKLSSGEGIPQAILSGIRVAQSILNDLSGIA